MRYVDKYLESDDFDKGEVERAAIMHRKVTKLLNEKDQRIEELEEELRRRKFFNLIK
jgi:hypothetical protein